MSATRYLPFAGRLLIGLPFAMSGLGKLAAYGAPPPVLVERLIVLNGEAAAILLQTSGLTKPPPQTGLRRRKAATNTRQAKRPIPDGDGVQQDVP